MPQSFTYCLVSCLNGDYFFTKDVQEEGWNYSDDESGSIDYV